jgi:uncharacterized protein YktA (UPF0223 family)
MTKLKLTSTNTPTGVPAPAPPKLDLGIQKRARVLQQALIVEGFTSMFLGGLLRIKNIPNSRAFGNTGSALSFKNKIDLLMDMGVLNDDLKAKFITFMEIRNQFMHNMSASTYVDCFKNLSGKQKWILGIYPQPGVTDIEQALDNASVQLGEEVVNEVMNVFKHVEKKIEDEVEREVTRQSKDAFFRAIPDVEKVLNDWSTKLIKEKKEISTTYLEDLGTVVRKAVFSSVGKHFKTIVTEERAQKEAAKEALVNAVAATAITSASPLKRKTEKMEKESNKKKKLGNGKKPK